MNRVTLKFNNTLTNLAGAEFGKEYTRTSKRQIRSK